MGGNLQDALFNQRDACYNIVVETEVLLWKNAQLMDCTTPVVQCTVLPDKCGAVQALFHDVFAFLLDFGTEKKSAGIFPLKFVPSPYLPRDIYFTRKV